MITRCETTAYDRHSPSRSRVPARHRVCERRCRARGQAFLLPAIAVDLTVLPVADPNVIFKPLPEGAVLFSMKDEVYYGLNPVGMRIWQLLPPVNVSLDHLCAALHADYPQVDPAVLKTDVVELLEELTSLGLLQPRSSTSGSQP